MLPLARASHFLKPIFEPQPHGCGWIGMFTGGTIWILTHGHMPSMHSVVEAACELRLHNPFHVSHAKIGVHGFQNSLLIRHLIIPRHHVQWQYSTQRHMSGYNPFAKTLRLHSTIPVAWQLHHPDYGLCIPRMHLGGAESIGSIP